MPAQSQAKTPVELLREEIDALQREVESTQEDVRLASLRDEVEDLETNTTALPQRIRDLRAKGYVFEKQLESRAEDIKNRWGLIRPQANLQINKQSGQLVGEMRSAEGMMLQLASRAGSPAAAHPIMQQLKSSLSTIESKVSAAQAAVRGMYDTFQANLQQLLKHLERVEWTLDQVAEGCFKLTPTECAVMAVAAVWVKDGKEDKDDPRGVLYLTDQRILFEQKQEIATKKVLFITTEKQKVQQLLVDTLSVHVQTVTATKQGLFKNEDNLELTFASGAPFYKLNFHIDGQDSREWQALLGKVTSGQFDADRAVAPDQAAVDRIKHAPSECPACGAAVTQPVLRGMDSLTCQYCGVVMRLD